MHTSPAVLPGSSPVAGRAWKGPATLAGVAVLVGVSVVVAVTIGPANLSTGEVWQVVTARVSGVHSALSPAREAIVWELRIPRVLTAAAVGAGLGLCGVVMQAILRNPLADPYLLGLSSGATAGAAIVIVSGIAIAVPVVAFGGAVLALLLTVALAGAFSALSVSRTILAGVAVSAALSAVTSLVIFWGANGDTYREILGWLLGSLAGATWVTVVLAGITVLATAIGVQRAANGLDAFAFGEHSAAALGIPVGAVRWGLLLAVSGLTGVLVSVSGAIGFVGLVVPHAVRLLAGPTHRRLLPLSALVGALVLVWADTLARTVFDPRELPVGVVTALLGAPVFAFLLIRARRKP